MKCPEMTSETRMSFFICSCRRKEETDGADCTSSGRVFQKMGAAVIGRSLCTMVTLRLETVCSDFMFLV